jgi:hypothetical protein
MARDDSMAGRRPGAELATPWSEVPREHMITRLYLLPARSAAEFTAELEDETEEPTPALRALLKKPIHKQ